jgi:hypothetical protein
MLSPRHTGTTSDGKTVIQPGICFTLACGVKIWFEFAQHSTALSEFSETTLPQNEPKLMLQSRKTNFLSWSVNLA